MKVLFLICFLIVEACSKNCVHEWRSYHGTLEPMYYGVFVGSFDTGVPIFVGRGSYDDLKVTGRIQTTHPTGLYHISGGSVHHIKSGMEYLVKNPNYDYKWIPSINGEFIEDAISPGYTPSREVHFVGRIKIDGRTFYGKMIPNVGLHYENANGDEIIAQKYEMLVCTV
ncbi:unnamed protein product [Chironomus riparius]|uniref:Uncharacterized protein n=1 Tax=Chironomus riparius TaxID=315576 RepID=A0A9N9RJY3_9DIPT|nr:unnamed protein product [Chironomus riparius]